VHVRQKSMKVSENHEFLVSDRWKCSKSSSGAHHWLIEGGQMTCRYCELNKPVDTNRYGWSKPETKNPQES
jgi:hypothetical protein